MKPTSRLRVPLALLLAGSLAGGVGAAVPATATPTMATAAIPTATAVSRTAPTPTASAAVQPTTTTMPVKATLVITPTATNRGGLVTVSGIGFMANETVNLSLGAATGVTATARADAMGILPPTGLSIPYSVKVGAYTITATGATSKRTATAAVAVQALAPAIALSATTASPGDRVTVTGKGFGRQEQVTLALNGAALLTVPTAITTTNGSFSATFAVPTTLLRGANTVSAIGNESRVTAVAALAGRLSRTVQFYFAGGMNTAAARSFVNLLNTNGQPASVRLTFYFNTGASFTKLVTVAPTSQKTVGVAGLGLPSGTFGLQVRADRQISAQVNIERPGMDGDNLLGNSGLGTTWYLAEGYTGLTFHETVSILNPDPAVAAHVQLRLLPLGGGPGKSVPVIVAPHSNSVTDINSQLPGRSISIIATADHPVVVERTLTFSNGGYGLTTRAGTNVAATSWIFAEGTTVNRFQTFLTVLNPNMTPALVTASFFGRTGGALGSRTILVRGQSRANIKLNDFLSASGIASVVTSDQPVVVERPEYFGSPNAAGIAGSDVFGRNGAGVRWSFPGGNTKSDSEFLLLYNPSPATVQVQATFYGTDGKTLLKTVYVPPTVRYNINVNTLAVGVTGIHGAVLQSVGAQGFVAEQTVFAPNHTTLRSTQGLAQ